MLPKFLILNYHRLIAPAACAHNLFDVGFDQFRLQLNRLKENNVNFVSLENPVMSQTQLNVAITFDDGTLSDLIYALPALKETGIPASFFISPQSPELELDWTQLREISAGGFTIGSHGLTHASMTGFGTEDRFYEMAKSRAIIEQEISKPVLLLAFPFGRYNRSCQFAAKLAGYTATYTTRFSYNTTSDGYVFHRWSVKYHTNIVEFERVINGNPLAVLNKKARSTANYLAGKLNLQLNLKPFKAANV